MLCELHPQPLNSRCQGMVCSLCELEIWDNLKTKFKEKHKFHIKRKQTEMGHERPKKHPTSLLLVFHNQHSRKNA